MVLCPKKQKHCGPDELTAGDGWIALSLAKDSGLLLSGRTGKHTDELAALIVNTEGKLSVTDGKRMVGWGMGASFPMKLSIRSAKP